MAETLFTPAPWKTGDCDGFIIWAGGYRSVKWIECEPGPEAVHIGDAACPGWAMPPEIEANMSLDDVLAREHWIEECKANARLMAAAPRMYDLLHSLAERTIEYVNEEPADEEEERFLDCDAEMRRLAKEARALLAEARGDDV